MKNSHLNCSEDMASATAFCDPRGVEWVKKVLFAFNGGLCAVFAALSMVYLSIYLLADSMPAWPFTPLVGTALWMSVKIFSWTPRKLGLLAIPLWIALVVLSPLVAVLWITAVATNFSAYADNFDCANKILHYAKEYGTL